MFTTNIEKRRGKISIALNIFSHLDYLKVVFQLSSDPFLIRLRNIKLLFSNYSLNRLFTTNQLFKRKLEYLNLQPHNLSLITGMIAGFIGNFIYVPMEVLKMRAQHNRASMTSYSELVP
jgi:Mitochondrial carrier protein